MTGDKKKKRSVVFSTDPDLLMAAADASEAAYDKSGSPPPKDCTLLEKHNDYVVWRVKGKGIVVAFRGTEPTNLSDVNCDRKQSWKDRVAADKTEYSVVKGFDDRANMHVGVLEKYAKLAVSENCQLVVSGHSLGAAESVLQVLKGLETDLNVKKLFDAKKLRAVTFGCPVVGDSRLSDYLNKKKYSDVFVHMVDAGDPVFSGSKNFQMAWRCVKYRGAQFLTGVDSFLLFGYFEAETPKRRGNSIFGSYLLIDRLPGPPVTDFLVQYFRSLESPLNHSSVAEVIAQDLRPALKKANASTDLRNHEMTLYRQHLAKYIAANKEKFELTALQIESVEAKPSAADETSVKTPPQRRSAAEQRAADKEAADRRAVKKRALKKKVEQAKADRQRRWRDLWKACVSRANLSAARKEQLLQSRLCQACDSTNPTYIADVVSFFLLYARLLREEALDDEEVRQLVKSIGPLLAKKSDAAGSDEDSTGSTPSSPRTPVGPGGGSDPSGGPAAPAAAAMPPPLERGAVMATLRRCLTAAAQSNPHVTITRANAQPYLSPEGSAAMAELSTEQVTQVFMAVRLQCRNVSTAASAETTQAISGDEALRRFLARAPTTTSVGSDGNAAGGAGTRSVEDGMARGDHVMQTLLSVQNVRSRAVAGHAAHRAEKTAPFTKTGPLPHGETSYTDGQPITFTKVELPDTSDSTLAHDAVAKERLQHPFQLGPTAPLDFRPFTFQQPTSFTPANISVPATREERRTEGRQTSTTVEVSQNVTVETTPQVTFDFSSLNLNTSSVKSEMQFNSMKESREMQFRHEPFLNNERQYSYQH